MSTATLTSKGQVTIPKEVREFLHLNEGDRLEFLLEDDGSVRLQRRGRSVLELAGILHRPGMEAMSVREMKEAIMETVIEDDERIQRQFRERLKSKAS
jgi:antitoxin PrlF